MDEFNKLLEEYKNQYLQFLSTGEESYKRAYKATLDAIEDAVTSKRQSVESEKNAMKHFATSYANTNKELESIVEDGLQETHDQYTTSKDRFNEWTSNPTAPPAPIDVSVGYDILLRFGILLILLPILLFIGTIMPFQFDQGRRMQTMMIPQSP
jgi:hypothetical protein